MDATMHRLILDVSLARGAKASALRSLRVPEGLWEKPLGRPELSSHQELLTKTAPVTRASAQTTLHVGEHQNTHLFMNSWQSPEAMAQGLGLESPPWREVPLLFSTKSLHGGKFGRGAQQL